MDKSHAQPGAVRIIGGQWKRRKLPVPQGPQMPDGLRPTADRVRETLFNWLGQDLSGWRCLDVCAGTGALGFEAASRGAAHVTLVEQHPAVVQHLRTVRQQLDAQTVHVVAGEALAFLRQQAMQAPASVDALFFDPPYAAFSQTAHEEALRWAASLLRPDGSLYLETGREWTQQELADLGWMRWRYLKAGAVHAHLLRLQPVQGDEA
ncbi:MAG: 16S rRNA (guanine(966)-N(2))-methyltransferase RsmD [Brachymonas sp.]|nr:16S rRNA (guanine(966)-N(2))-methyltransferase RsmD [Brachymonas sp.]